MRLCSYCNGRTISLYDDDDDDDGGGGNRDQSNVLDSGIRRHHSPQSPGPLHPTSRVAVHGKQVAG